MALVAKNLPANARDVRCWFNPWVGKIPWRRKWQPTPVFLPGKSRGQRSLVGYSAWDCRVRHDWAQAGTHAYTHTHTHTRTHTHALCPWRTVFTWRASLCDLHESSNFGVRTVFFVFVFYGYLLYRSSVCAGCYPLDSISNRGLLNLNRNILTGLGIASTRFHLAFQ